MKSGVRAAGVAESYAGDRSTLGGAIVRADRVVEGFAFASCTVGGTDATAAVRDLLADLLREDVQYVLIAGIAPAWYNVLDLRTIHEAVDRPVLSVSFEDSEGLETALREAFSGEAMERRLATYRRQPPRECVAIEDGEVFVRALGVEQSTAAEVVRGFTPTGERPEPVRVARLAARAVDRSRRDS